MKTAVPRFPSQGDEQTGELRARVHEFEQELEVAKFKALYYSAIVKVAEQELGVDIEKSRPGPVRYQVIRFRLVNYPKLPIR